MYKLLTRINTLKRCKGRLLYLIIVTNLIIIWPVLGFGQALRQLVTVDFKNTAIKDAFKELNSLAGLKFVYSPKDLDENKKVSGKFVDKSTESVINFLLSGMNVTYSVKDNTIIIRKVTQNKQQAVQQRSVSGRVVDESGLPLGNVTVKTNTGSHQAVTDDNGYFTIATGTNDTHLQLSLLGYSQSQIDLTGQADYTVQMAAAEQGLDEVVVVGYGVQRRSEITGAISSVTSEQVNKMPTTSINEMLRGAAPGVQVTMGSAAPGGTSNILIRGRRSLSAGNDPLYVVDGVPMAAIDDLNSNEIASIEILKDASAQSIYGARAANGVILVTTKRGIVGKTTLNVNSYGGVQDLYRNFEFYDGEQWAAYRAEAFYNAFGYYNEEEVFRGIMGDVYRSKDYLDWEDVMLSPSWQNKNDVLIQSGNEKTKYALSLGHFYQDGIVPSSDFKRFTGRLNIDQKLSEKIALGSNIAYTKSFRTI